MANFKVKCLSTVEGGNGFTTGRVYDVKDGRIIDDDGLPRPLMCKRGLEPIKTIDDIKNFKNGNWSWIGQFEHWQSIFSNNPFYVSSEVR